MRPWAIAIAVTLVATTAHTREVAVRSGEHNSFTRVVILFPQGTDWNARQETGSITLTASGGPWEYDLSTAFRLIPRSRILSMDTLPDGKSLRISTAERVNMATFGLIRGGAVIDVSDAPTSTPTLPVPDLPTYSRPTTEIRMPDERIRQAEADLIAQLGRAAAQGAVIADPTRTRINPAGRTNGAWAPHSAEIALAMQAQTVMDRDTDIHPTARITPQGYTCAPNGHFDVATWLDDRPFTQQISEARQNLVGEFDRPNPDSIAHLAKVYLALGMGAEAQGVLNAFDISPEPAQNLALSYMAAIQNNAPLPESPYPTMLDCSGRVALWALLGATDVDAALVDFIAVQSGFSSLPSGLRDVLGPRLMTKLLQHGAIDAAEGVRNTFRRSNSADRTSAQLAEGELDFARRNLTDATRNLASVAEGHDERAARALEMQIAATVDQGKSVTDADMQRAADFARLLGPSAQGFSMRGAEALGAASVGDFDHAFGILDNLPDASLQTRDETTKKVFSLLAHVPDDALFLSHFLPRQEQARTSGLPQTEQVAISARLIALGFAPEAMHALSSATRNTPQGRVLSARAALANGNTGDALVELAGLNDPAAMAIRAEALSTIGEHAAAARLYADMGNADRAAQEAWRSGSWTAVSEFGNDEQKAAIQRTNTSNQSATGGPLGRATSQITQSQADRAAFEALLQRTPPP